MVSASGRHRFTLNGRAVRLDGEAAQTTLLDFIRSRGLTGAKEGCAEGECGACAVLFVCPSAAGSAYRSVNSCLIPLPAVADREVITVEALGAAGLQETQRAMAAFGGSQCGYCTPGFIVSMFAEQFRPGTGERDHHALGGNLCRCTGYRPIGDALHSLGPPPEGDWKARLEKPAPTLGTVTYSTNGGRFSRPETLAQCFDLCQDPDSRFVAGNTDLGIATNLRGDRFHHLISLEGLAELRFFDDTPDAVEIGAALTLTEIGERWTGAPAFLGEWLQLFASLPIRNRATLGGNLANASPIGDSAPLLLALDAEVALISRHGTRRMPLSEFFLGYRQTALRHGEILLSIRIPKPFPELIRFYKVAKRRMDDISTVAAAIAMNRHPSGRVETVRVALGGVAATPWRAREAEAAIENSRFDSGDLRGAQQTLQRTLKPIGDHRGSSAYRLAMAQSLLGKFRQEAMA